MSTRTRNKFGRGRRGLTLIELMLSLIVTAFIGLGVAAILQTAAYGTSTKRDSRRIAVRAERTRDRINDAIRNARAFLASGSNYLVLWQGDGNGDNKVNITELQLLELASGTQVLTSYSTRSVLSDTAYAAGSDFYSVAQTLKNGGTLTGVAWASSVSSFTTTLNGATPQLSKLATWSLSLANGNQTEPVTGAGALRQAGTPQ